MQKVACYLDYVANVGNLHFLAHCCVHSYLISVVFILKHIETCYEKQTIKT